MILAVIFRYAGIALQFLILATLARHLDGESYGRYLFVLSAVLPTYYLLGFGVSETVVREVPALLEDGKPLSDGAIRGLVGSSLAVSVGTAAVVAVAGSVALSLPVVEGAATWWFALTFFLANGLMFNAAQVLLAIGSDKLGAFFFYPAVNVSLIVCTVPYLILAAEPTFTGVAVATSSASIGGALVGLCVVVYRVRPGRPTVSQASHLVAAGIRLVVSRALYALGLWLPTFVAGLALSATDAGLVGTAGRLAVAAAAVTAAVRFAVRPGIVRSFRNHDIDGISRLCGSVSAAMSGLAILALIVHLLVGQSVTVAVFGPEFRPVAPLLAILLVGVIAESLAGPVDEVLKMTGHDLRVLAIFGASVPVLAVALVMTARFGPTTIAVVQVVYSVLVFGAMTVSVRRSLGVWIRPRLPSRSHSRLDRATPTA